MEDALDQIAEGKENKVALIDAFYRGSEEGEGLVNRIQRVRPHYPVIPIGEDPKTGKPIVVRIGRFGPYLQRGEGGTGNVASVPDNLPPDELTLEKALQLLDQQNVPDQLVCQKEDGSEIWLRIGRYGQYLELRKEQPLQEQTFQSGGKKKGRQKDPSILKRVSLPKGLHPEELTPELAQQLMALPRELGKDPETGEPIFSIIGRYGPYIKRGDETRRLSSWREALEITLEQAGDLLKMPKTSRRSYRRRNSVIKEFPYEKAANGVIRVMRGKYGPYVTDGTVNARLPQGWSPEEVTEEQARQLLVAKRGS
jgi:DNA topoisomerase-1